MDYTRKIYKYLVHYNISIRYIKDIYALESNEDILQIHLNGATILGLIPKCSSLTNHYRDRSKHRINATTCAKSME